MPLPAPLKGRCCEYPKINYMGLGLLVGDIDS